MCTAEVMGGDGIGIWKHGSCQRCHMQSEAHNCMELTEAQCTAHAGAIRGVWMDGYCQVLTTTTTDDCDDSRCSSIGNDCFAPGDEPATCNGGYTAFRRHGDSGLYRCCHSNPSHAMYYSVSEGGSGTGCDRDFSTWFAESCGAFSAACTAAIQAQEIGNNRHEQLCSEDTTMPCKQYRACLGQALDTSGCREEPTANHKLRTLEEVCKVNIHHPDSSPGQEDPAFACMVASVKNAQASPHCTGAAAAPAGAAGAGGGSTDPGLNDKTGGGPCNLCPMFATGSGAFRGDRLLPTGLWKFADTDTPAAMSCHEATGSFHGDLDAHTLGSCTEGAFLWQKHCCEGVSMAVPCNLCDEYTGGDAAAFLPDVKPEYFYECKDAAGAVMGCDDCSAAKCATLGGVWSEGITCQIAKDYLTWHPDGAGQCTTTVKNTFVGACCQGDGPAIGATDVAWGKVFEACPQWGQYGVNICPDGLEFCTRDPTEAEFAAICNEVTAMSADGDRSACATAALSLVPTFAAEVFVACTGESR
jgi:hypothetical protein